MSSKRRRARRKALGAPRATFPLWLALAIVAVAALVGLGRVLR